MSYTRREIGQIALAAFALPTLVPSRALAQLRDPRINGVIVGAQTYSFRAMQDDPKAIIEAMRNIGLFSAELMSNQAETLAGLPALPNFGRGGGGGRAAQPPARGGAQAPAAAGGAEGQRRGGGGGRGRGPSLTPEQQAELKAAQEAQTKWRLATSPATWAAVRKMWNDAGIDVRYLCYNMGGNMSDEMIEYGFQMAKALGVRAITTSTQVSMAKRIGPFADKHQMIVAVHGHADIDNPNQISTEATFLQCFEASKNIWANLDIGHYTAAGLNPVDFLQKHHGRITNLHIKDRKNRANGQDNMPFGQGDTPIKEVLQLLKTSKWDIAANIEFEYQPNNPLEEMPKCLEYIRQALA
jgi:sugar phosphate isomerase/epimerase